MYSTPNDNLLTVYFPLDVCFMHTEGIFIIFVIRKLL